MIKLNPDFKQQSSQKRSIGQIQAPQAPQLVSTNLSLPPSSYSRLLQDEISRIPLLTKEQEHSLTRRIYRFRQSFQRLILKDPEVIRHLAELIDLWKTKQLRLDSICNVALSETAKRKKLEPALVKAVAKLRNLANELADANGKLYARKIHRIIVKLVETLCFRPSSFESAPYKDNSNGALASNLINQYRDLCQQLTQSNLRLVAQTARKICGQSQALDDMIQEGTQGLMHAVVKFDHTRNLRFSTYAIPWIRQYIFASLINHDRNIRIPESFRNKSSRVLRATEIAKSDLQSTQTDSYRVIDLVSRSLKLDPNVVARHIRFNRVTQSLDQPSGTHDTGPLSKCFTAPSESPQKIAESIERRCLTQKAMAQTLKPREKEVLTLRYGLEDGHDRSFAEVGRLMGITRERVRQIEKPALEKLSHLKLIQAL